MKRMIALCLALTMLLGMAGCGAAPQSAQAPAQSQQKEDQSLDRQDKELIAELIGGQGAVKEVVQPHQHGGGVGASSRHSRGGGDAFFNVYQQVFAPATRGGEELLGGAPGQIAAVGGEVGVGAGQGDGLGPRGMRAQRAEVHPRRLGDLNGNGVAQGYGLHDTRNFVVAVGAAGRDVQEEVDLGGGGEGGLHI